MYTWIWRHLPGGRSSKIALFALLVVAASLVLLFFVFPRFDGASFLDGTVG